MADITLTRFLYAADATLGIMVRNDLVIACTVERPWANNLNKVSCIPTGLYQCDSFISPHNGNVWLLKDVPNRAMIEIHSANFAYELEGCIAVGDGFFPDKRGVMNSRKKLNDLKASLPKSFSLMIRDFQSQSSGPNLSHNPPLSLGGP